MSVGAIGAKSYPSPRRSVQAAWLGRGARLGRLACIGRAALLLIVALASGAGGCSNMSSYASDSRQQGIKLYNDGHFADAAGSFNTAIRQDPRDYASLYYLGRSYEALEQYHQAVQAYRTSLDVMQNSLVGREDAASRLKTLEGLASAAAKGNSRELEQSALQHPDQPTPEDQFVRAKIFRIHGDVDSAIEAYNRAQLMDPMSIAIAREFGLYLVQLGQNDAAQAPLKKAYVLNRKAGRKEDPQIVAALRQVGVVPGPSLLDEGDLAQPIVPRGPLPPLNLGGNNSASPASDAAPTTP